LQSRAWFPPPVAPGVIHIPPHPWLFCKAPTEPEWKFLKASPGVIVISPRQWRNKKALKEPYMNNPR
jgi:hypothetical protein